jgi:hypothetical protein
MSTNTRNHSQNNAAQLYHRLKLPLIPPLIKDKINKSMLIRGTAANCAAVRRRNAFGI